MAFFKKKQPQIQEPMDLDAVMKKYDQESNVRIWEGKAQIAVNAVLAIFSLFCIYVTLFATWLEELRLTTFVAFIVFMGYLVFPARKGHQRVNYIPWYDVILMVCGTGAFLYFAFNARSIIQQGSIFVSDCHWYRRYPFFDGGVPPKCGSSHSYRGKRIFGICIGMGTEQPQPLGKIELFCPLSVLRKRRYFVHTHQCMF